MWIACILSCFSFSFLSIFHPFFLPFFLSLASFFAIFLPSLGLRLFPLPFPLCFLAFHLLGLIFLSFPYFFLPAMSFFLLSSFLLYFRQLALSPLYSFALFLPRLFVAFVLIFLHCLLVYLHPFFVLCLFVSFKMILF